MWNALIAYLPDKNKVVVFTANDGDAEKAEAAAWEVVRASVKQANTPRREALKKKYPMKSAYMDDDPPW